MNLFFIVFACSFYRRTRWLNWFTIDVNVSLLLQLRLHTNNFVCVFFLFFIFPPIFCSSWYSPLKIILKVSFTSGSVNNCEYSPQLRFSEYPPMFTLPSANNCWVFFTFLRYTTNTLGSQLPVGLRAQFVEHSVSQRSNPFQAWFFFFFFFSGVNFTTAMINHIFAGVVVRMTK